MKYKDEYTRISNNIINKNNKVNNNKPKNNKPRNSKSKNNKINYNKINKRTLGEEYEKTAGEYIKGLGYEIIEYNYRCHYGEIDIIAMDKCDLVFIEVKFRHSGKFGTPFEAVNRQKQNTIMKTATYYMLENDIPENTYIRFDIVGIEDDNIVLIKNAFGGI